MLTEFWAAIASLGENRQGTTSSWIKHIIARMPVAVLAAFDRERAVAGQTGASAEMSLANFKNTLGRACAANRQRNGSTDTNHRLSTHPSNGDDKKKCDKCGSKFCPKGMRDDAQCDVYGEPTTWRISRIPVHAQKDLNEKRVKAGKKALDFPKVSAHSAENKEEEDECAECADDVESPVDIEAERERAMAALDAFMAEHHVEVKGA